MERYRTNIVVGVCRAALILTTLSLLWYQPSAWSQVTAGNISGTVRDPSGSVVPGASVVIHNNATGSEQTTQSNGDGLYGFASVAVGRYDLGVTHAGFKPYKENWHHH